MRTLKRAIIVLLIASCVGLSGINETLAQEQSSINSESTQPITWGGVESTAAGSPNNCSLGLTQFTIQIDGQDACGSTHIETFLDATPSVKLYMRYGQRVTVENGQVIADYRDESESPY